MLLAHVAFVTFTEGPLHSGVLLEVRMSLSFIIFYPLIEHKLWVIYKPGDNKLIDFIVVEPTDTLTNLRCVNSF